MGHRDSQSLLYLDVNCLFNRKFSTNNSNFLKDAEKHKVGVPLLDLINDHKYKNSTVNTNNLIYITLDGEGVPDSSFFREQR